jgi:hypothetical protein
VEKIGVIPKDGVFEKIYEYDLWVLVNHNGAEGWASSALVCAPEKSRGEDVQFLHARTETVREGFRHFFGIFNASESIFSGRLRLSIYNGRKIIFSEEYDFSLDDIPAKTGRSFHVDTEVDMTGYLLEVLSFRSKPKLP